MSDNPFHFLAKKSGGAEEKAPEGTPPPASQRPTFVVPDFAEIQRKEKEAVPINMFRPKGLIMQAQGQGNRGGPASTSGAGGPGSAPAYRPVQQQALPSLPPAPTDGAGRGPTHPPAPLNARPTQPSPATAAAQPSGAPVNAPSAFQQAFGFARNDPGFNPLPRPEELERRMPMAPVLTTATTIPPHHANSMAPNYPAGATPIAWNGRVLLVNKRQKGNPILDQIRNVRWQFADNLIPDYQMGLGTCALFLSLKFHMLHKDYILPRMNELRNAYRLRVLLLLIDSPDGGSPDVLQEITNLCVKFGFTLVCAWSPLESARYLETFKAYETKPATAIMERAETDYVSRLVSVLTSIKGVNRTDALALASHFGTLADLLKASMEELSAVPGVGPKKVRRLYETFNEPFFRAPVRVALPGEQPAAAAGAGGGGGGPGSNEGTPAPGEGGGEDKEEDEDEEEMVDPGVLRDIATDRDIPGQEGRASNPAAGARVPPPPVLHPEPEYLYQGLPDDSENEEF